MPELPEVETMVRGLRSALEGKILRGARVIDQFLLRGCTSEQIERAAAGARVEAVGRRGKWVVMSLAAPGGSIVIQPRMTGGFWLVTPRRPDHARLIFEVDGRRDPVWFCDARRLGNIAWYADPGDAEAAFARAHGPDALEIAPEELARRLRRTDRSIKPALMDQRVLAGVGNIYADEILHRARLHPERRASGLRAAEVARLHEALGAVLREAIAAEGSTFDEGYRAVLGQEGGFLTRNAVYGRTGEPCPRCGASIARARIAGLTGRSTHYCPRCQPAPRRRGPGLSGRGGGDRVK
jgi:formamidopyrimidine-DNA glycosylase